MAAIVGPGGPTMATKYAVDGPGTNFGGITGGVTGQLGWLSWARLGLHAIKWPIHVQHGSNKT